MNQELEVVPLTDTRTLVCSNCDAKLLIIRNKSQSVVPLYNIRVECPLCGDYSYDEPVYGQLQIIWPEGIFPKEVETRENVTIFKTKKA